MKKVRNFDKSLFINDHDLFSLQSGLDPVNISDITIPFNFDKMAGVCGNIPGLSLICGCMAKAMYG